MELGGMGIVHATTESALNSNRFNIDLNFSSEPVQLRLLRKQTLPILRMDRRRSSDQEDQLPVTIGSQSQPETTATSRQSKIDRKLPWYKWVGRGMYLDVKRRIPYFASDWKDAWNYRVVPATFVSGSPPSG